MYQQQYYQPSTQFSVFPPVIKNLLIINGLVFFAQAVRTTNAMLIGWFALWPFDTLAMQGPGTFWPWQLVTYSFLHGGIQHLFFNMLALWMFGMEIENTWGSRRFAIFYFTCVIGAALLHMLMGYVEMDPMGLRVPTLGASGGVYGILLAFGMMFPNRPIYVYFLLPVKAKWFVIGYGLIEFWSGMAGLQSGIAHFAHLGGMLFGFLLILYWRGKLPVRPKRPMYW